MSQKTDFNGKTTTYDYDEVNRLTKKTPDPSLNEPDVTFTYTPTGQRESMTDASGTTSYTYDDRDRLKEKVTPQGTLTYTYDLAGNLLSMDSSHANGMSLDYEYDALNRLTKVIDHRQSDAATTYTYDNVGNLDHYLYPNGVMHQYTYNTLNRLTNLTISKVTALASYAYDLGPVGNRTAVTELNGRKASYAYDDLYRLTEEKIENDPAGINGTIGYVYDPVGNRKTRTSTVPGIANQTFTYDNNDRLNTDAYDANGNTVGSDSKTYDYDYENHLTNQNRNGVVIVYDGDGNRVSKTVGGVTTQYPVDDRNHTGHAQVVEEIVNNVVAWQYTYGLDLISQKQGGGVSFYGYDGHGSVRFLIDANGAVTDTYDYDAFGNLIHSTGNTPNNYLYSGEQLDPNVGFYYLRARYYNGNIGRFSTTDPFGEKIFEPFSLHKYSYAKMDPINVVDPSGLLPTEIFLTFLLTGIVAIAVGFLSQVVKGYRGPFGPSSPDGTDRFTLEFPWIATYTQGTAFGLSFAVIKELDPSVGSPLARLKEYGNFLVFELGLGVDPFASEFDFGVAFSNSGLRKFQTAQPRRLKDFEGLGLTVSVSTPSLAYTQCTLSFITLPDTTSVPIDFSGNNLCGRALLIPLGGSASVVATWWHLLIAGFN